ncbi:hypothetical protein J3R30DRAFT_3432533 [Lentinula aciculospora]|uniref:C3H1-type domain-containing protein n=1 Tax=Lentinula aciculospora TaxID=153920 RepID=A0A9W9AS99_9AGAR|nr:hypothetical protein J3R30DRAFT_3432533 [Lentinula aciculospora]
MSYSKGAPYKKYQCRYFDETGRPLNPCKQGDRCRFVHPGDPQWPGVKCYPYVHKNSGSQSSWTKIDRQSPRRRLSSPPGSRGGALVPQGDLFRRCKVEEEDISLSHVTSTTESNWKQEMAFNRYQGAPSTEDSRTNERIERGRIPGEIDTRGVEANYKDNANASINASDSRRTQTTSPLFSAASETEARQRSERFISMFRDVAMYVDRVCTV